MRGDSGGLARQVSCPECGAAPGQPCHNIMGKPFGQIVHRDRAKVAKETAE